MRLLLEKKSFNDVLVAGDQATSDFIHSLQVSATIHADFKRMRNIKFHKKFFALLNFLYQHWTPAAFQSCKWEGVIPQKNFDRFRKDITILAGFYNASYRLDGSVRIEAKSISFGKMSEEDFQELYSRVIDVGIKNVLTNYSKSDLQNVVEELLSFS